MQPTPRKGFTLTEVIIAMVLGSLMMAAVMSTFLMIIRSSQRVANYNEMETEAARSLETLSRELRMATSIASTKADAVTGNEHILSKIKLTVPDEETNPASPTTYEVEYWFRTEADGTRTLVRQEVGSTEVRELVRNIDGNRVHNFIRYDQAPSFAINDYSTNQIQLTMTVMNNYRGLVASTTERVISAYFVLRNR